MRKNKLKARLKQNKTALNAWLTIPSPWAAEILSHVGFDALTIDMQHGLASYDTAIAMLQAISTSDTVPLVRVPWNEPALIMRMLDGGAYGVIAPMVNNRADAEAFVGACHYPPMGYRSYGPIRASLYGGEDYLTCANQEILTLAQIETAEALENLDQILSVTGLDGVYVGTFDLSISLGLSDLGNLENTRLKDALDSILGQSAQSGHIAGVHARRPEEAVILSEWGFNLITPVNDSALLASAAKNLVDDVKDQLRK